MRRTNALPFLISRRRTQTNADIFRHFHLSSRQMKNYHALWANWNSFILLRIHHSTMVPTQGKRVGEDLQDLKDFLLHHHDYQQLLKISFLQ